MDKKKYRFIEYEGNVWILSGISFNNQLKDYNFHLILLKDYLNNIRNYTLCVSMEECNEINDLNKLKLLGLFYE